MVKILKITFWVLTAILWAIPLGIIGVLGYAEIEWFKTSIEDRKAFVGEAMGPKDVVCKTFTATFVQYLKRCIAEKK